jgi:TldD protein
MASKRRTTGGRGRGTRTNKRPSPRTTAAKPTTARRARAGSKGKGRAKAPVKAVSRKLAGDGAKAPTGTTSRRGRRVPPERSSAKEARPTVELLAPAPVPFPGSLTGRRHPERVLPLTTIERLLSRAMRRGGDFAEVYVEKTVVTALSLDEGKIRAAHQSEAAGVGIRVVSGAQVGYAYSDDLDDAALERCADTASLIAQGRNEAAPVRVTRRAIPEHYRIPVSPSQIDVSHKAALLLRGDGAARRYDARIAQVMGSWVDQSKTILVANTLGHFAEDVQDLCRVHFTVVAIDPSGDRRTGSFGGGGRVPFGHFETFRPEDVAAEAARQATAMLGAVEAPAGSQTVVLAPGWSGILLHEAVGHGLEADFIRKGTSLFTGQLGQRVASELVTVIDDGTLANARGTLNVDDEGHPAQRKVLIENGILKGYLYDSLNARLMGQQSTGSGRRESFRHAPLPRMTNTFLAPGEHEHAEIVGSVSKGLYCAQFGGGQVDITNGNFVFEVSEAYLIEDGRLTAPVKGATLIGIGPEALKKVVMVGNDPTHDPGIGTCGKAGQSVPVGVGLPTVRLDDMTVGGTRT